MAREIYVARDSSLSVAEGPGKVKPDEVVGALGPTRLAGSTRVPCQVCGRRLVPLADGTSRRHRAPGSREAWSSCSGSGYRLARWPVGEHLRHHAGSLWRVEEDRDRSSRWGDYLIVCVVGTRSWSGDEWLEAPGKTMVAHGEYMHRNGWRPEPAPVLAEAAS